MSATAQDDPAVLATLAPGLRRLRAANPGPMTGTGTNTYLLGTRDVAVIDPGPDTDAQPGAIEAALGEGAELRAVLVTHAHRDHSALAPRLAARWSAPVLAFGNAVAGRTPRMAKLAAEGLTGGGEGVDAGFVPDELLADGQRLSGTDWALTALWTPGHMANHLCFLWQDTVFTGDLVMGWATSLVSPPDGDMGAYMRSCQRVAELAPARLYPGHGAPVDAPAGRLAELLAHRTARERALQEALKRGLGRLPDLVGAVYGALEPAVAAAAARNLLAHLIDLEERGLVIAHPGPSETADFRLRHC